MSLTRVRGKRPASVARYALFVLAGVSLLVAIVLGFVSLSDQHVIAPSALPAAVGSIALYMAAHVVRALRLGVLIDDDRVGVRSMFIAHTFAAGVSLLIPFKLGELYRVIEIDRVIRNASEPPTGGWQPAARALLMVWIERVLDLVTLAAALVMAIAMRSSGAPGLWSGFSPALLLAGAVVLATLAIFFVLPDNIESVKLYIIRRYNAPWTVGLVRTFSAVYDAIGQTPAVLERRGVTLIFLTLIVWALEVAGLSLFLPATIDTPATVLSAVGFFVSKLIPIAGSGQGALAAPGPAYAALVFLALQAVAACLFLLSVRTRMREAFPSVTMATTS